MAVLRQFHNLHCQPLEAGSHLGNISPPLRSEESLSLLLTLQGKRFAIKIKEDFSPPLLKKLILSLEEL